MQLLVVDGIGRGLLGPSELNSAVEHFIPRLQAPGHLAVGIWIAGVAGRVVVHRAVHQPAAGGHGHGFGELVGALPVEVVVGHRQQHFAAAVGALQLEVGGDAPVVGVRHQ